MMSRIHDTFDSILSYILGLSVPLWVHAIRQEDTPTRAHRFSSDRRHIIGLPANSSSCYLMVINGNLNLDQLVLLTLQSCL